MEYQRRGGDEQGCCSFEEISLGIDPAVGKRFLRIDLSACTADMCGASKKADTSVGEIAPDAATIADTSGRA